MELFPILISILTLSSSLVFLCTSDDRLTPGESLSVNQTIVSDGGTFKLGFFSPFNSSTNHYLGVWYNKIPDNVVVWIANRDTPVKDSSALLRISNDTNLMVSNSDGSIAWSSNVTGAASTGNNTALVLLDSGNLVLRVGTGMIIWQSFDHPVDTMLPGMKLWSNYRTGLANSITSWKNAQDPSTGDFSLGGDPRTSLQLFIWKGSKPYWRSNVWDGVTLTGALIRNSNFASYLTITVNEEEYNYTFSLSEGSVIARFFLQHTGVLELLEWDDSSKNWTVLNSKPSSMCDYYGICGPFGICDSRGSSPTCNCLQGFEAKVQEKWDNRSFSEGCVRRETLKCDRSGDGFLRLNGMKLPDEMMILRNLSMSGCEATCLSHCSCTAYAFLNSGAGSTSRCLVWNGELIDLEQINGGGQDLYVRLVASELGGKRNVSVILIVLSVLGAILLIVIICTLWKCRKRIRDFCRDGKEGRLVVQEHQETQSLKGLSGSSTSNEFVGKGEEGGDPELPLFNFESIAIATSNFSILNKLGQGGFGKVYKGILSGGQEVAVKRLSRCSGQGLEEFKNEATVIAKLQHRNLVRLLGCCIQGEERILIYEYMPNKSLDAFIFDPSKQAQLDWGRRFSIAKGIARGLMYLHQDSRLRIIHRDMKTSNILLDGEMNPKISDFGMAKIFGNNQNQANTNRVVGTYGYMSPEYAMEGLFSVKSDVYSFGVLLLEIVSSRRNSTFHFSSENFPNLLAYVWQLWSEDKAMELVDTSIRQSSSPPEVLRCVHVGLLCVQDCVSDRPTMSSVVFMLENGSPTPVSPRKPMFTIERSPDECEWLNKNPEAISVNDVTITRVEGR